MKRLAWTVLLLLGNTGLCGADDSPLPPSTVNLLVGARMSGNLESFDKGLRGQPDHMVYDLQRERFVQASAHHEYGVGFEEKLGVVSEANAAYWLAEWPKPVEANVISLSGVYPNQPQPQTAWKIEVRTTASGSSTLAAWADGTIAADTAGAGPKRGR
jgi:G:T-mismatch repair DNA endonuclease (very short patch repair protein)